MASLWVEELRQVGTLRTWHPHALSRWPWLHAVVTTRVGGQSQPPYDALNLGLSTGDRPEDVEANRETLRRTLQLQRATWHSLHQVHGNRVVAAQATQAQPAEADGLWTGERQQVLVVGIADCVPVFLWDARSHRVALVHAGWRGTAAGIVRVAVDALRTAGSRIENLWMALGPCIGACCYEVGPEVCDALPDAVVRSGAGNNHLDLRRANRQQARTLGIPDAHLLPDPPCTGCSPEWFFSHRKQGPRTGRQWALMWTAR